MVYITLDELKEILPGILDSWVDDEGDLEYIFQEIEQKCYVGTNKRKGKQWRKYIEDNITEIKSKSDMDSIVLTEHGNSFIKLIKRINELNDKLGLLNDKYIIMSDQVSRMEQDIKATKSMAQTAKQRTEVDYTKCSKEKSDADVVQEVYNRMVGRGATREELDIFRNLIQKYNALEKKEIKINQNPCETCKYTGRGGCSPCNECNESWNKWEAKDND